MIPQFKIHRPSKTNLPDLSDRLINQNDSKVLEAFEYINYPVIQDGFSDHLDRRQFLKEIYGTKAWGLMQKNKLRKNNILKVLRVIAYSYYFFKEANIMTSAQAMALLESFNKYPNMSLKDKIEFTRLVDKLIISFISN